MEYHRLSKEQLEELHQEFAKYLAALSIDRKQWEEIKANDPQTVDLHLDQFSDLVWGDVLSKDLYLVQVNSNY